MIKKLLNQLKCCFLFWKNFLFAKEKRQFLVKNKDLAKTHSIVLLATALISFITYSSLKPAVKGVCRVILRNDADLEDIGSRVVGIEAKKVKTGTTLREVSSIGTLKANQEVIIKCEINGKIEEILFKEGSEVSKGEILIKFDDDIYLAEKERFEAEYILRREEFNRMKKLFDKNVGSQKTYDEALAHMQEAKAQLDTATVQLARTTIKAPFSGVIGIIKGPASIGNIIQQHTELVAIVDNSKVKVEFMVPAKYISDISKGQTVDITIDAFKDKIFSGTVDAIDSVVDTRNHSILVRAVIPNKSGALKHGMFANVKLVIGEKTDVVLVEEESLDREGSIEFVWIIDEKGRAYRKRVLTGAKDANGVEILAGLQAGETVVSAGQLKLSEGTKVEILNEDYQGKRKFDETTETEKDNHVTENESASENSDTKKTTLQNQDIEKLNNGLPENDSEDEDKEKTEAESKTDEPKVEDTKDAGESDADEVTKKSESTKDEAE